MNIEPNSQMKKVFYLLGLLGAISFSIGWTFGVLHLPGAFLLSVMGAIGFGLLFIPFLAMEYYRSGRPANKTENIRVILGVSAAFIAGVSAIFEFTHLQGSGVLIALATLLFAFGFLPLQFWMLYSRKKP